MVSLTQEKSEDFDVCKELASAFEQCHPRGNRAPACDASVANWLSTEYRSGKLIADSQETISSNRALLTDLEKINSDDIRSGRKPDTGLQQKIASLRDEIPTLECLVGRYHGIFNRE